MGTVTVPLHVGVGERQLLRDHGGDGALQLLLAPVPQAGAYRLEVQHLGVDASQISGLGRAVRRGCARGRGRERQQASHLPSGLAGGHQGPLPGVPALVLGVHGEEAEHHQVQEGADHRQARQDVDEAEGHVARVVLQRVVPLQGHVVPEPDGGERDEAEVEGVEEAPPLAVGERHGSHAQRAQAGEEAHRHHVGHGDLGVAQRQALLGLVQQVPDEGVDPLAQALEHDQGERDPQEGVEHAEHFPRVGAGRSMAVT